MGTQAKHTKADDTKLEHGRKSRTTGSSAAGIILLGGAMLGMAGAAIEIAPRILPDYAWIQRSAMRHGTSGVEIALGGALLVAIGMSAGASRSSKKNEGEDSDRGIVVEQLAVDLAQLRGAMQELRVDFVFLKDSTQSISKSIEQSGGAADSSRAQQEGMFRLAASLDQVGERLDQRIQSQSATDQRSIQEMRESLIAMQSRIADIHSGIARIESHEGAQSGAWGSTSAAPHARSRSDSGEVDVWVELESEPASQLGLLDSLDEFGRIESHKTSPSLESENGDRSIGSQHPPAAALPQRSPGNRARRESNGPMHTARSSSDGAVDEVLDQLKSLLSDARVRRAIDSIRPDGR